MSKLKTGMDLAVAMLLMSIIYVPGLASDTLSTHASNVLARDVSADTPYRDSINATYAKHEVLVSMRQGLRLRRQIVLSGCIMPYSTLNGTYSLRSPLNIEGGQLVPYNSIVELTCPPGYTSSKNSATFCDEKTNGWYEKLGTCQKLCKRPQSLTVEFTCSVRGDDGQLHRGPCNVTMPFGSMASAKCRNGYHLMTNGNYITCLDGIWVHVMPSCTAECGKATLRGTPNIINGSNTVRGEFPWHVAIYSQYGQEGESLPPKYICGGSIITSTIAISAAHCFYDASARKKQSTNLFKVAVGKFYSDFAHPEETMNAFIQKFDVKRIEIPEDYQGITTGFSHDLALIVLEKPIVFSSIIMPVCLNLNDEVFDEEQSSAGQQAKVAGFGLTSVNGNRSNELKTAVMPIVSKYQCRMDSPKDFAKYVVSDKLCAGQTTGVGVCQGDSGGGLVVSSVERYNPTWYLIGIVSTSPKSKTNDACTSNTYSAYTKPFAHKVFIENIIQRQGCEMPSNPPNGKFFIIAFKNASPGEGVQHKSRMTLQCDQGFTPSDYENNMCDEFINDWIRDIAECVAIATTTTTQKPPHTEVTSGYEVVADTDQLHMFCYFSNWAHARSGVGSYTPHDINISLCSHIIYGFAHFDGKNLNLQANIWPDINDKYYEKVTAYKEKGKKVLLSIYIEEYRDSDKFSRMVNNATTRQRFASNTLKFILDNNFSGLNLEWQFPVCWEGHCDDGPISDKESFSALVKELRSLFVPRNLLLTCIIPPNADIIDHAYDIPSISRDLDWLIVEGEGYTSIPSTPSHAYHISPLYAHSDGADKDFNVNFIVDHLISRGAVRSKLILGVPLFGIVHRLSNIHENGLFSPIDGNGDLGEFTDQEGLLSHYEICDRVQNRQWQMVTDAEGRRGPYAFHGNQWVSFDDVTTVRNKIAYIKTMRLGGAFANSLDTDDFRGLCGCEMYPLLSAAARDIGLINTPQPNCTIVSKNITKNELKLDEIFTNDDFFDKNIPESFSEEIQRARDFWKQAKINSDDSGSFFSESKTLPGENGKNTQVKYSVRKIVKISKNNISLEPSIAEAVQTEGYEGIPKEATTVGDIRKK